ncbi:MAG: chloride channel protein [Lachnospiraceae bacterium]|nr:chloride channel protein [Lachnospiraceae bacterium]
MNQDLVEGGYVKLYGRYVLKWIIVAGLIGIPCGVVGALFYLGVARATELRETYQWLYFCLPLAGLFIVWFYKVLKVEGANTDTIVESARTGEGVRFHLVPAIFAGTVLTHLCGGSSGREGAALQIGGGIGANVGTLLKLSPEDKKIATMAGMAAFFTALFGTPITATVFVAFVLEVGSVYTASFFPSFIASISAYGIARTLGMQPFRFPLEEPGLNVPLFLKVMLLALLCSWVSVLFVKSLHFIGKLYEKYFPNPCIRVLVGAGIVLALTFASGTHDYNGAGTEVIKRAIVDGETHPWTFLLKILFTALTLEAGFKGGEIVPSFYIGSTFGCFMGTLLGMPPQFAAAIGLAAVFGGATNSVIAPMFLAVEAFGCSGTGIVYFTMACIEAFMFSGYNGLYSKQTIRYSKLRARLVNIHTNQRPRVDHVKFGEKGIYIDDENGNGVSDVYEQLYRDHRPHRSMDDAARENARSARRVKVSARLRRRRK